MNKLPLDVKQSVINQSNLVCFKCFSLISLFSWDALCTPY